MSVAFIELVEMTATLNVVVSINSTTVMQTFGTAPSLSRPAPYLCKNQFEDSSYKRLNKKQLGKEGKRKIKAHEVLQILFIYLFIYFIYSIHNK